MAKVNAETFIAAECRRSYFQFFKEFWSTVAAEKLSMNWHIEKLCNELQYMAERVFLGLPKKHDLIINCPPGTTKSKIVSVLFQPWCWTRFPSMRFISGCHSERLALDHSRLSRDCVLSDKYQSLFPEIKYRGDQNTKSYSVNTKGGDRFAVGCGGSPLGMHAHCIIIDDPIDPQGALSDLVLNEANLWISEGLSQRRVDKLVTPTIMVMQRVHQFDPTGAWLERNQKRPERLRHICLPASLQDNVKPLAWRDCYIDGKLDSVRLPQEVLDEAYQTLGETGYAGQYDQTPTPRGGALFKVDKIQFNSIIPMRWKKPPVRYWDKAATLGGGAFTVGTKMGLDMEDRVWVLDIVRVQLDSASREKKILNTAETDGRPVRVGMEQEPAASGKESAESSALQLSLHGFRVTLDRVTGDKFTRADTFSVPVNLGKVIFVPGLWNRACIEEMRYFPNSKYKDQVDSLSGGFAMLAKKQISVGVLR